MNMHVGALQRAQDSLPSGLLAQERAREKALKKLRRLRQKAEAEIERLLIFLDEVDGYTMNELDQAADDVPCDTDELEPSLGAFDRMTNQTKAWDSNSWSHMHDLDMEEDNCDREDGGDEEEGEPSGIADVDGLIEQHGHYFGNTMVRETAGEAAPFGA